MLVTMGRRGFLERYAGYLVEPWGDSWEQAAVIACEVRRSWVEDKEGITPQEFIPNRENDISSFLTSQRRMTAEESKAAARARQNR